MLVRIEPGEVRIGMFIQAFEGSWFDHPFWRSRFVVETDEEVLRIKTASIRALVIDRSRSRVPIPSGDAAEPGPDQPGPAKPAPPKKPRRAPRQTATSIDQAVPAQDRPRARRGYAAECRRAGRLANKSRDAVAELFESARLGRAIEAKRMVPLAQAIAASIDRDSKALVNLVRLKAKDEYTYLHSVAVCALMINFARHLKLDDDIVESLGVAGLLHDVGKIGVAEAILAKPGTLSEQERHSVQHHPIKGYRLLAQCKDVPELALEVCLRHHEKLDGTGYPDGFAGDMISIYARMGAICDVYDAITSDRPYKGAWTPCEALTQMQGWHGHFDPRLLEQFADSLGLYPIGTLVQLSNGELAIVMGSTGANGEDVAVRTFFDTHTLDDIAPQDRIIAPCAEHPRIIGRDNPDFWRLGDWPSLRARVMAAD